MGTFVFLTNQYLPNPGATGLCVHQLAKQLAADGNEVFTVCYETVNLKKNYDGVKVIGVKPPVYCRDNVRGGRVYREYQNMVSRVSKLVYIGLYPLRSKSLVRRYKNAVREILKERTEVTLVASFTPLEAVFAGAILKREYGNRIRFVYYSTDTLSNEQGNEGVLPASYRQKCGMHWEVSLFGVADLILIMECHQKHYFSDAYRPFHKKMELVNFPLLSKPHVKGQVQQPSNVISMVYSGTLYRGLRNPQFLCDCLVELSKEIKICVDFLGGGDCDDIIDRAGQESKGCIKRHGMQSHDTALRYIGTADVLLSIGNVESPMAPSKIYEYMSTGKPIVHIYTWEEDPCILPLKKYGNALIIREGDKQAVKKMKMLVSHLKRLSFESVKDIFIKSSPGYTTELIKDS